MEEELVSPKKAAKMLSVTTDCLRRWEIAGKIRAIKTVGGQRRYRLDDINKLLGGSVKYHNEQAQGETEINHNFDEYKG